MPSDDGDIKDRVWNFLSDLGPLLNLFGEGITQQFVSGSIYLEDHILLATLPIGILTIIVSAIRVAGPMWLKAIIGRSSESRGAIELQLMSSTSQFVCELWDGQSMVRVLATGPIQEIIYVARDLNNVNPHQKCLYRLDEAVSDEILVAKEAPNSLLEQWFKSIFSQPRHARPGKVPGISEKNSMMEIFGFQNSRSGKTGLGVGLDPYYALRPGQRRAPNVLLNIGKAIAPRSTFIGMCFGLLIQIGVLIVMCMVSYNSNFAQRLRVQEHSPQYVFALALAGTIMVSIGVLVCALVIDGSTQETIYTISPDTKRDFQLFWLQKGAMVNDQDFGSYAIFPRSKLKSLISSHPYDFGLAASSEKSEDIINPIGEEVASVKARLSVTVASVMSLTGFLLQVAGLRGMPLAAPLAVQVGTAILLVIRAFIRRGRSMRPHIMVLPANYELDKLALEFTQAGNPLKFWTEVNNLFTSNSVPRIRESSSQDHDLENAGLTEFGTHGKPHLAFSVVSYRKPIASVHWDPTESCDIRCPEKWDPSIVKMVDFRVELGRVTALSSPAQQAATALIGAIEGVMDCLFPSSDTEFRPEWRALSGYKRKAGGAMFGQSARPYECLEARGTMQSAAVVPLQILLTTEGGQFPQPVTNIRDYGLSIEYLEGYGWHVNTEEIEAILSLSCYTAQRIHSSSRLYALRSPMEAFAPEHAIVDQLGDSQAVNIFLELFLANSTQALLEIMPIMDEVEFDGNFDFTCPNTLPNVSEFMIASTNVIGSGCSTSMHATLAKWQKFKFKKHLEATTDVLELEDFVIDSRKVYVPVACSAIPVLEDLSTVKGMEHSNGWTLATISAMPFAYACAQAVFASFLESLLQSSKLATLPQMLTGRTQAVSSSVKNAKSAMTLDVPHCRLQNEGVDALVVSVKESGLYESSAGAEFRIVSSLATAGMLPVITDPFMKLIRGQAKMSNSPMDSVIHDTLYWLLKELRHRSLDDIQLRSAVLHTIQDVIDRFRRYCIIITQDKTMVGGPWVRTTKLSAGNGCTPETVAYGTSDNWDFEDEFEETPGMKLLRYGRLKLLVHHLVNVYLRTYNMSSQARKDGWMVLCGWRPVKTRFHAASFISEGIVASADSLHPMHLQAPDQKFAWRIFEDLTGARLLESNPDSYKLDSIEGPVHCLDSIGDSKSALSSFAVPRGDVRSIVPFHFTVDEKGLITTELNHGLSELHCAAALAKCNKLADHRYASVLRYGMGSGVDHAIDLLDEFDRTPLHLAVNKCDLDSVRFFMERGANIHAPDKWGRTPLHLAIVCGRTDIVTYMLSAARESNGVRSYSGLNATDKWGFSAVHYAVISDNPGMIRLILEQEGCELRRMNPREGLARVQIQGMRKVHLTHTARLNVPLTHFCYSVEVLSLVLASPGRKLDILDEDGTRQTLLHAAAQLPSLPIVDLILSKDVYASLLGMDKLQDEDGKTPLHVAANAKIVSRLLKRAELLKLLNTRDRWGCTALHDAITSEKDEAYIEELVSSGAETIVRDKEGHTPLMYALRQGRTEEGFLEVLSRGGALDVKDSRGRLPTDSYYTKDDPKICKILQNCRKNESSGSANHSQSDS